MEREKVDVHAQLEIIAIAVKTNKPEEALSAAIALVGQVFRDLQRAADALEEIAITQQKRN